MERRSVLGLRGLRCGRGHILRDRRCEGFELLPPAVLRAGCEPQWPQARLDGLVQAAAGDSSWRLRAVVRSKQGVADGPELAEAASSLPTGSQGTVGEAACNVRTGEDLIASRPGKNHAGEEARSRASCSAWPRSRGKQ